MYSQGLQTSGLSGDTGLKPYTLFCNPDLRIRGLGCDTGAELRRRMAAAGVQGGLPALELLTQLLFGRRHPAQCVLGLRVRVGAEV